jgi:hypothetical protein
MPARIFDDEAIDSLGVGPAWNLVEHVTVGSIGATEPRINPEVEGSSG